MSFLDDPRLTFAGLFQADPSTVNNDPRHFDNQTFSEAFQEPSSASALNGWWNPMGTGVFRFASCTVRAASGPTGASAADGAVGLTVGNTLDRASGKIVDLDPDWQLASQLYGLQVSLVEPKTRRPLMIADFEPAPFRDLWFSRSSGGGDMGASAMWQTRLTDLRWDLAGVDSPCLHALAEASAGGPLSIRITTFAYQQTQSAARFTYGRLLGAIGLQRPSEPRTFVAGRRFMPIGNGQQPPANSALGIGCFSSTLDAGAGTLALDLSNALPLTTKGTLLPIDGLQVVVLRDDRLGEGVELAPADFVAVAPLPVPSEVDYAQSGGITVLPIAGEALALAADHPLAIVAPSPQGGGNVVIDLRENAGGLEVRTDNVSFRLDPDEAAGNTTTARLWATRYGQPYPQAALAFAPIAPVPDTGDSPPSPDPAQTPRAPIPFTNTPLGAIAIAPPDPVTGDDGTVEITFTGPQTFGAPRQYMDGQVYNVAYNFRDAPTVLQTFDQYAILVFSSFAAPDPTRWEDLQPILQQYANLYPIMSQGLFDFSRREVADANAHLLHFVFSRDVGDPNYMPVTRDLSAGKRAALLRYFAAAMATSAVHARDTEARFTGRCPFSGAAANRSLVDIDPDAIVGKGGHHRR